MSTAEAPIKVSKATRQRVRLGAVLLSCTQGDLVERAVGEYFERNAGSLAERMELAREALQGGDDAAIAFMTDLTAEDIRSVS